MGCSGCSRAHSRAHPSGTDRGRQESYLLEGRRARATLLPLFPPSQEVAEAFAYFCSVGVEAAEEVDLARDMDRRRSGPHRPHTRTGSRTPWTPGRAEKHPYACSGTTANMKRIFGPFTFSPCQIWCGRTCKERDRERVNEGGGDGSDPVLPTAESAKRSPYFNCSCSFLSESAVGIDAPTVIPWRSRLMRTRSSPCQGAGAFVRPPE